MKKHIINLFWIALCATSLYYAYTYSTQLHTNETKLLIEIIIFAIISGCSISAFAFNILFNKTSESLKKVPLG